MATQGVIRKLMESYGFIKIDGGGDVFFHRTSLQGAQFESLQVGQAVEFDVEKDSRTGRDRAANVKPAQ